MSEDKDQKPTRLIARVLGPDEPELTCEECFAELDRYVELSLGEDRTTEADRQVPGMRAHLDGCPACAEDYESLRALVTSEKKTGGD